MTQGNGAPVLRGGLDGLRALAVLLVMAMHAGVPGAHAGYLGVDAFFVLSGFLITSLLEQEVRVSGRLHFGRFMARRFLRLMPLYGLYLILITALVWRSPPSALHVHDSWDATGLLACFWLYAGNLAPLGGIWDGQALTGHLWSLSVEAQYYLVWPLILPFLLRRRVATPVAWSACGLALAAMLRSSQPVDHLALHTRGVGLMIGSAVALSTAAPGRAREVCRAFWAFPWAMLGMLGSALMLSVGPWRLGTSAPDALHSGLLPAFDLATAGLVGHLWWSERVTAASLLAHPWLRFVGVRSYGMYLLHMLAHWATWDWLLADIEAWNRYPKLGLRLLCFFGLTLAAATLSYRFFERPFLELKRRFRGEKPASEGRASAASSLPTARGQPETLRP